MISLTDMVWLSKMRISTIEAILKMVCFMDQASNLVQIMNFKENSKME
jgi:hypothetical protein